MIAVSASFLSSQVYDDRSIYVKYKFESKETKVQSSNSDFGLEAAFNIQLPKGRVISKRADSLLSELSKVKKITFRMKIDPFKMSQKYMRLSNVEYAEPIPKSTILANETDDPELDKLYHLYITNAFPAWELMTGDSVVIGIVDTGIDFDHEDLENVVWYNPGETGMDEEGNEKSTNGIDDDENGYIDDWRGWDFGSESGFDNDATYGSDHGVHVSGITAAQSNNGKGVSGICPLGIILPVKVGRDFGLDNPVNNEFEGLLYAAIMGADVINCSWGSPGYSQTNELVTEAATELGALVVAAAGNNNNEDKFFPASYETVLSVASSAEDDVRSGFSNYNTAVDITAPGSLVFSTEPDDKYDYKSGTSMASPVAAGAAAVIKSQFPDYTPKQIKLLLEVNTDDIYDKNSNYIGALGSGRLNLFKAISRETTSAIAIKEYTIASENKSDIIEPGTNNKLNISFENVLDSIGYLDLLIENDSFFPITFSSDEFNFTELSSGEIFTIENEITFTIPEDTPENYIFNISFIAYDNGEFLQRMTVSFVANPSYFNLENDETGTTITSNGNIGFNDFPNNVQGLGYQTSGTNALFEGGFMITQKGNEYVADGIRNKSGNKSKDLFSIEKIKKDENQVYSLITSKFTDKTDGFGTFDSLALGVDITQKTYQFTQSNLKKSILIKYELFNKNEFDLDSIYAGLFFDWDFSDGGSDDFIYFDTTNQTGIVEILGNNVNEKIGVKYHSDIPFNCYAVDNASFDDEMGIYDGFTEAEKQMTMTSGIGRVASRERRDVSMVSAAGPMYILAGEKVELYFSISSSDDVVALNEISDSLDEIITNLDNISTVKSNNSIDIMRLSPNPIGSNQTVNVLIKTDRTTDVYIKVHDYMGRLVMDLGSKIVVKGYSPFTFSTQNLSQGTYYFVIEDEGKLISYPFTVINQ